MGLTYSKTYAEAVKVADHDARQVDLSAGFHHTRSWDLACPTHKQTLAHSLHLDNYQVIHITYENVLLK